MGGKVSSVLPVVPLFSLGFIVLTLRALLTVEMRRDVGDCWKWLFREVPLLFLRSLLFKYLPVSLDEVLRYGVGGFGAAMRFAIPVPPHRDPEVGALADTWHNSVDNISVVGILVCMTTLFFGVILRAWFLFRRASRFVAMPL